MNHYTPKFKSALNRVVLVAQGGGEGPGRLAFRDEMLKLGHEERVRNLYRVNDKLSNKALPFIPNGPQEAFMQTTAGRDIILKCRQVGFTTAAAVEGLDWALWEENQKCGIMAHLQNTVTTIFNDLVKYTYEWFIRDWGTWYNPTQKSDSRTELAFIDDGLGRPLNSSMRVMYDFRGKTLNFLHVSEASRVEDDRLLGSLQGVPANGKVRMESTPNGRAGEFCRIWGVGKALGSVAPYRGFFVPWWRFYPEEPANWVLPADTVLTSYEQNLIDEMKLTRAHVAWRRWCIEANCQGSEERFENEYPTNDIDCFFTGEALIFPSSLLKKLDAAVRPPTNVGFLLQDGTRAKFEQDQKGWLAIWETPNPTGNYVIGADPSGGVGKDFGVAYVLHQQTGKIVARLRGQFEPQDFAGELSKLGTFYNKAWICVEANNHGHLVLHILSKEKQYKNLYRRQAVDELTNKPTTKVGFLTTVESKLSITEKLKGAFRDGKITSFDSILLNEMSAFVQVSSKTGRSIRREAAPGAQDDCVMACCFAWEMHVARPNALDTEETYLTYAKESYNIWDEA